MFGSARRRRQGRAGVIALALCVSAGACVSSGREDAGLIADTGLAATSALSADLDSASARLAL